jgi:hypothetical protein
LHCYILELMMYVAYACPVLQELEVSECKQFLSKHSISFILQKKKLNVFKRTIKWYDMKSSAY